MTKWEITYKKKKNPQDVPVFLVYIVFYDVMNEMHSMLNV